MQRFTGDHARSDLAHATRGQRRTRLDRRFGLLAVVMVAGGLAVSGSAPLGSARAATRFVAAPLPQHLRDTGLFVPGSTTGVREDNLAFSPQYPLWSDGASKRRWLHVPRGQTIDAALPDAWNFPPGTRLWKEFSHGRRVETRFIERLPDGSWRYATYVWNEAGTDALLAPSEGIAALPVQDAPEGRYAIPSEGDCRACHEGASVPVLGVSALQLSPDRDPLAPHADDRGSAGADLRDLVARGWLRNLPAAMLENPPRIVASSATERAALGYLHGNCGHCHSRLGDTGASVPVDLALAQQSGDAASGINPVVRSMIESSPRFRLPGMSAGARVVAPGHPEASVLALRMRSRNPLVQMPPVGTRIPDLTALVLVERWIHHDLYVPKEAKP